MPVEMTVKELEEAGEVDLGAGPWRRVEQKEIDLFADATDDHQWIHIDQEMAKQGPFGTTVAHGYLSLSLLSAMLPEIIRITDARMGINYGTDKVRFTAPVPSGSEVRLKGRLVKSERKGDGVLWKVAVEMEIKDSPKPAFVAEALYIVY